MIRTRQGLLAVVAVVVLFAIITDPQSAGAAVHDVLALLAEVVRGIFVFTGALIG